MTEEIKVESNTNNEVKEEQSLSKKELKKQKKSEKREKRLARIRKKFFKDDIEYQGPLSYRYLRILGWIAFVLGQLALMNSLTSNFNWDPLGPVVQTIFNYASTLMTPFFIIASFGMVLSGNRGYRNFILLYGAAFLAIGLGVIFAYYRYVNGLFTASNAAELGTIIETFISDKININVFADLFTFTLFHYFINYTPKKYFQGKKIYIFRLFSLLPVIYSIVSYVLKTAYALGALSNLPFAFFPFMTTKSPLVVGIFVVISLWIKNREKIFIKVGATKEQYNIYLNSKRNSLSFSIILSVVIAIFALIDFIAMMVLVAIHMFSTNPALVEVNDFISAFGAGQAVMCVLAIPFLMLYSYTRDHKNTQIDLFIPVAGIGLTAFVYLEFFFDFIVYMMKK